MTTRDTGLSGAYNCSDTSSQQPLPEQQPNPSSAMSAITVYPNPYYPPTSAFDHNQSNPLHHHLYRRPSQPGLPIYSNQCTPVPTASGFGVSDQYTSSENTPIRNNTGPPLPLSSSVHQVTPGMAQPPILRTNASTPITRTLSQPHLRISSFSNPPTPIDSAIHLDIVDHPMAELVTMLASKLQNLITSNDRLKHSSTSSKGPGFPSSTPKSSSSKSDSRLLSFHARNIPSITITAYLNRILKYCPTDPEVFISVLVYFDRILRIANHQARPIFGSYFTSYNAVPTSPLVRSPQVGRPHDDDTFTIDSFNVHRLVITTIAVATKFFSDQFYTNSRYARVGGLPLSELNHLEVQFLILQDFNLMIPPAEMQFYADHLLRFWIMEQRVPPQTSTNLEYTVPITPMTPGGTFSPQLLTPYTPSAISSTATTLAYSPFQPQYVSQPMDGVQSTNSHLHRDLPTKESQ